jgi:catechol 2,3-dioxygenase-like lactoylglutathione lyase family enzyme
MSIQFASAVPQFPVADVVDTAKYYQNVLGFEIAGYWDGERVHHDEAAPALFGIVRRDDVRLHFYRAERSIARPRSIDDAYDVYFHVAGIDELAQELRDRGADILDGPEDRVYGQRELVIRDCNGRVLAFGDNERQQGRAG